VAAAGAAVLGFQPYPDHHRFTSTDVRELAARGARAGAEAVLVTAKDAVKLGPLWPADARLPLWWVGCLPEVVWGQEGLAQRLSAAGQKRRR
jgi:tetraacyldisaccharide-1-P 4'-kinase